jgi:hypothetical protein
MGFLVKQQQYPYSIHGISATCRSPILTVYPFSRAIETIDEKDGPVAWAPEEAGEYSLKI